MINNSEVKVIFRKSTLKEFKDELVAIFPETGSRANYRVECYSLIDNFFDNEYDWMINHSKPVKFDTVKGYKELLAALVNNGYTNLKILKRGKPVYS